MTYVDLSASAQAAFAGIDQAARHADIMRNVSDLPGGFCKKEIKGKIYWYYQWKNAGGSLQQTYVGADDVSTRTLVAAKETIRTHHSALQQQARSALELGCVPVQPKHARIIGKLLDHGFFHAGGVLVGTHAFIAYQNIFGVRWGSAAMTLDLDFAHRGTEPGGNISLALDDGVSLDARAAIESLGMGFLPLANGTTFTKPDEPGLDLDFLTVRGRKEDEPQFVKRLNLTLQPLKFMEFSLSDPIKATLLSRSGPMVVNLPRPQRYAVHKLIVSGERVQAQRTKSNKDLEQASILFDYMLDHEPEELKSSWSDAYARGPGWRNRLIEGFYAMVDRYPNCRFAERMGDSPGVDAIGESQSSASRPRPG